VTVNDTTVPDLTVTDLQVQRPPVPPQEKTPPPSQEKTPQQLASSSQQQKASPPSQQAPPPSQRKTPPPQQIPPRQQKAPLPQRKTPAPPQQQAPPPPRKAPVPPPRNMPAPPPQTPTVAPFEPDSVAGRRRAGEPARRRVVRAVRRLFDSASGEVLELAELIATVQQPITTGRRIAVTGVRGGAGKTTVATLLARVFARRRADRVLAVDADPEIGSLSWRLGTPTGHSVTVLAKLLLAGKVNGMADLEPMLGTAGSGLWSVPAPVRPGAHRDTVTAAREVGRALSRHFGTTLLDCGHGMTLPAPVLGEAHAIVVAAPATIDGVRSTRAALDRFHGAPGGIDLSRVVVVLSSLNDRSEGVDLDRARRALDVLGVPVVHLGFDRHLAGGGVVDVRKLAEPTVVAATRVAALAMKQARPL
jgi:septum site-determining protein MinD